MLYLSLVLGLPLFILLAFLALPRETRFSGLSGTLRLVYAVIAGGVLFLPFFYFSYIAGTPFSWVPALPFFDWILPLAWGLMVTHAWYAGESPTLRYLPLALYLLALLPVFAINLPTWPTSAMRWVVLAMFGVSLADWILVAARRR